MARKFKFVYLIFACIKYKKNGAKIQIFSILYISSLRSQNNFAQYFMRQNVKMADFFFNFMFDFCARWFLNGAKIQKFLIFVHKLASLTKKLIFKLCTINEKQHQKPNFWFFRCCPKIGIEKTIFKKKPKNGCDAWRAMASQQPFLTSRQFIFMCCPSHK